MTSKRIRAATRKQLLERLLRAYDTMLAAINADALDQGD